MGICSSCESTSVATAKLILQDGKLQEVPCPMKVSFLLQKNPACFICNSDDMEFDDFISAINSDDELQPDQLYFALPMSWLKRPLRAEEMASLAVKASEALMRGGAKGCGCCGKGVLGQVAFSQKEYVKATRQVDADDGSGRLIEKRREKGGGGRGQHGRRGRDFTTSLTMVPEE